MIKEAVKALAENTKTDNLLTKLVEDPKYALRFLILANTAKDAINCGFYVNQSLKNKEIPEEKRNFVAALDMANGVLMIATQLLLGFGFTNKAVQDKINKKLFGNLEAKAAEFTQGRLISHPTDFIADVRMSLKNTAKLIPVRCQKGFTAISTIVITTILAKRVIVPFIATPLAGWLKNKYMDKKPETQQDKLPVNQNLNNIKLPLPADQIAKQNSNLSRASLESYNNFSQKRILFPS